MINLINNAIFLFKRLIKENYKTIYFNFRYFTLKEAIKFPVLISRNVHFEELSGSVKFECPLKYGLVKIGYGKVGIFDKKYSRSILEISGEIVFKGRANLGHGSKISVARNGKIIFGDKFNITAESTIISFKKIVFGDNCLLSWDILVMDSDHHIIKDHKGEIINHTEEIIIEDNVWIGCRTLILKGSKIPSKSVIAANTVVNKKQEDINCLYAGIPVRMLRKNITWD